MKVWKKLILCGFFLLIATGAMAARLVSDPYGPCGSAGEPICPVSAIIYEDGAEIATVSLQPDYSIDYDLGTMPTGEHTYTAVYVDALGRQGDISDPYLLLVKPAKPLNLRGAP